MRRWVRARSASSCWAPRGPFPVPVWHAGISAGGREPWPLRRLSSGPARRGSTISTPPRCGGGAGKLFFFLSLDGALDGDLARPAEPEENFCTFAMTRMLAEGCAVVNGSQMGEGSTRLDSLYRPAACAKITFPKKVLLRDTWNSFYRDGHARTTLACPACVCYKFQMVFRLTTRAFHQFSCARN